MNLLRAVGKGIGWLLGASSGSSESPIQSVAKIVDEYNYTKQEQAEDSEKSVADARQYIPSNMPVDSSIQQQGFIPFLLEFILRLISKIVDAANHAVRPWVTIELFGGLFGYWRLPNPELLHPIYAQLLYTVVAFWFGARVITKDIPAMIAAYQKLRESIK